MSGNPMYGWPTGNSISQWHQQGPPPQPSNTMHYSGSVPNNPMIGMPSSEALQPSMQSVQPIHSMPPRQPHQSLQQQQMPRTAGLYQPIQPTTTPSQSQLPQQNSQFQQHPQQSHYSQYSPSVLASQYWASPMTQQPPLGTLPSSQTTSSGFQQHHGLHQQSPTASPLPHQSVRGHPPTSHTPDRSNIPPTSSIQQTASSFPNSKDHPGTDQQMISSLSRQGLQQQQHSSSSMQMMQQNSSVPSINTLPVSPTHGSTASQMRTMQQPQQPASSWQQTNQYYQQQNQPRFPFAGSVNPYMPYGSTSGSDMPNNIAAPTAQSASTRHMIGQKPGIDNNDRSVRGSSSGWPSISGNLYPQQQPSAQGGGNNNYYGYDSPSYYSMPGQSNVDSSQSLNNANTNIHQNQYWNTPLSHGQTPAPPVNRPMSNSLQHHSLVQQSPSASPLPHPIRNHPPSSHTPDRSPSLGSIPPPPVPAPSFSGPGQQSATTTKNAGGSNSLAQLEQMVMPHLGGTTAVVKSPSHRSSTSSPIINSATSSGGGINQQLPYSTNYNSASDSVSAPYFNSSSSGQGQQHGYFPQYGTSSSEIPKTSSMWPDQTSPQTGPSASGPSSSMMDTSSQYGQSNQYETQPNASYGDYTSAPLPTSSHEYSHISQSETTSVPAPEVADPYAIDFQTFDDYDEQPSTLKSKKGRPKKGDTNETKKERKPRAPRASKNAAGPKGKKAKANAVSTEQSVDHTLQPVQFESSDIVSNEYNPSMINQEHYSAPQDPYNSNNSHMSQPESQNMYDQTNLSNLQSTIKPGDNQQLGAPQEYMPYSDYSQQNSKPSDPLEGHQSQQDDNPIGNSIKTSDKIEDPTYQDNLTNSQLQENNNGEAVSANTSHTIINSPIAKKGIPKCVTPSIHEGMNKQTQDTSIAVSEASTLEALSNDAISMSDNVNLVSDATVNHLNQTESICDETSLEHTQEANENHNIVQNESMQMHVMETSNQPAVYIPSQTLANPYSTQQSHHHSASSSPSVYGPNLQPPISTQMISSSPSHSPTRASCPTRSMPMSGTSPTSMVTPMHTYGNQTMTHQGLNDGGSLSQNLPPTSSGYLMNSPSPYQSVQAQQQSIMDTSQSHPGMNSNEPLPYQTMSNQSHMSSSTGPPFMSEATSLSGQMDEAHTMIDDPMSTFNGDQTLTQQVESAPKKSKKRTKKDKSGDSSSKRKSKSKSNIPPPDASLSEVKLTDDHTEKIDDPAIEPNKVELEGDGSAKPADPEVKPKPKRKRPSRSNAEKSRRRKKPETTTTEAVPVEQDEPLPKIHDSSIEEPEPCATEEMPDPDSEKKAVKPKRIRVRESRPSRKKKLPKIALKFCKTKKRKRLGSSDNDQSDLDKTPPPSPDELESGVQKRRSARNTKRQKYTENIELGFSDDDDDSRPLPSKSRSSAKTSDNLPISSTSDANFNETIDGSINDESSDVNHSKENNVVAAPVEDTMVVEKILASRMGTRELEPEPGEVMLPDAPTHIEVEEFHVKYKNLSYLHCDWRTEEELEKGDKRVSQKLKKFKQRKDSLVFDYMDDESFDPQYCEVDRILAVNEHEELVPESDDEEAKDHEKSDLNQEQKTVTENQPSSDAATIKDDKSLPESGDLSVENSSNDIKCQDGLVDTSDIKLTNSDHVSDEPAVSGDHKQSNNELNEEAEPKVEKIDKVEVALDSNHDADTEEVTKADSELEQPKDKAPEEIKEEVNKEPQETKIEINDEIAEGVTESTPQETDISSDKSKQNQDESVVDTPSDDHSKQVSEVKEQAPKRMKKKIVRHYLIKWRALAYEDSTWELEDDLNPAKIAHFLRFKDPPPKSKWKPVKRPKAEDWKRKEDSPVYKSGNTLREYQLEGLSWLTFCWYQGRNCILADEMGLGKTIQSIAFINEIYQHGIYGPFLIIVPLSTVGNWAREFETWTDLNVITYHGSSTSREMLKEYEMFYRNEAGNRITAIYKFQVMITTFEIILSDCLDLREIPWRCCIIDEAHRLKNRNCKLLEGLRLLNMEHKVLLTGTPLQNNTEELFSLLNFLNPVQFASNEQFIKDFGDLKTEAQVDELKAKLKPMMLRRLKEDVEKSLAPKEETIVEVELTNIQKKYYRAILEKNFSFLSKGQSNSNIPNLMNTMMELRKCCIHPYLINGAEEQILYEAKQSRSGGESLSSLQAMINASGKLVLIDKLLPRLKSDGHRVLIFSQMVRCLDILEDYVVQKRYPYERIDGRVRGNLRQQAIDRYSKPGSDRFVFLLCTRAGGLGINLTAADTVIIFDSDWNPQNDLQAQARCHRIGQSKAVKIYRLICRNTYEREMFDKASLKLGLDKAVLQSMNTQKGGVGPSDGQLSKKEIEELLRKGAYGALMDDDNAGDKFCEEDIDQILSRRTQVITIDNSEAKGSTFSKATFSSSNNREDIELDDPNFWEKWAKKANLDSDELKNKDDLIVLEPRKRTQTKRFGADDSLLDISDLDSSDEDEENISQRTRGSRGRVPKTTSVSKRGKRRAFDFDDDDSMLEFAPGNWTRHECCKIEKGLLTFGWDRWDEIIKTANFKRKITKSDCENVARVILLCCLTNYKGDEKIKSFIWEIISPQEDANKTDNDLDSSYSSSRGRKSKSHRTPSKKSIAEEISSAEWPKDPNYDPGILLPDDQYRRHLQRHSNKVLLRVKLLHYLKTDVIGDAQDQISAGISAKDVNIPSPSVDGGDVPVPWWDDEADKSLVIGIYKHGYDRFNLMRQDPSLCFFQKCGPPDNAALDAEINAGEDAAKSVDDEEENETQNSLSQNNNQSSRNAESEHNQDSSITINFKSNVGSDLKQPEDGKINEKAQNNDETNENESKENSEKILDDSNEISMIVDAVCSEVTEQQNNAIDQLVSEDENKNSIINGCDEKLVKIEKSALDEPMDVDNPDDIDSKINLSDDSNKSDNNHQPSLSDAPQNSEQDVKVNQNGSSLLSDDDRSKANAAANPFLPFPSQSDLNQRFRRIITSYQRNSKRQEIKMAQKVRDELKKERTSKFEAARNEREERKRSQAQKWSRREEGDFYRTISSFGVDYKREEKRYDWNKFRSLGKLEKKMDETMDEYYKAFVTMCKKVTSKPLTDEEEKCQINVDPITEERASRCLSRIEFLSNLREEIVNHPELDERLKLCQTAVDLPDWWICGKHDKELLLSAAKHGLARLDFNLAHDKEYSFIDVIKDKADQLFKQPPSPVLISVSQLQELLELNGIEYVKDPDLTSDSDEVRAFLDSIIDSIVDAEKSSNESAENPDDCGQVKADTEKEPVPTSDSINEEVPDKTVEISNMTSDGDTERDPIFNKTLADLIDGPSSQTAANENESTSESKLDDMNSLPIISMSLSSIKTSPKVQKLTIGFTNHPNPYGKSSTPNIITRKNSNLIRPLETIDGNPLSVRLASFGRKGKANEMKMAEIIPVLPEEFTEDYRRSFEAGEITISIPTNEATINTATDVPITLQGAKFMVTSKLRWPKDKSLQLRLEHIVHAVEKNEWPSSRQPYINIVPTITLPNPTTPLVTVTTTNSAVPSTITTPLTSAAGILGQTPPNLHPKSILSDNKTSDALPETNPIPAASPAASDSSSKRPTSPNPETPKTSEGPTRGGKRGRGRRPKNPPATDPSFAQPKSDADRARLRNLLSQGLSSKQSISTNQSKGNEKNQGGSTKASAAQSNSGLSSLLANLKQKMSGSSSSKSDKASLDQSTSLLGKNSNSLIPQLLQMQLANMKPEIRDAIMGNPDRAAMLLSSLANLPSANVSGHQRSGSTSTTDSITSSKLSTGSSSRGPPPAHQRGAPPAAHGDGPSTRESRRNSQDANSSSNLRSTRGKTSTASNDQFNQSPASSKPSSSAKMTSRKRGRPSSSNTENQPAGTDILDLSSLPTKPQGKQADNSRVRSPSRVSRRSRDSSGPEESELPAVPTKASLKSPHKQQSKSSEPTEDNTGRSTRASKRIGSRIDALALNLQAKKMRMEGDSTPSGSGEPSPSLPSDKISSHFSSSTSSSRRASNSAHAPPTSQSPNPSQAPAAHGGSKSSLSSMNQVKAPPAAHSSSSMQPKYNNESLLIKSGSVQDQLGKYSKTSSSKSSSSSRASSSSSFADQQRLAADIMNLPDIKKLLRDNPTLSNLMPLAMNSPFNLPNSGAPSISAMPQNTEVLELPDGKKRSKRSGDQQSDPNSSHLSRNDQPKSSPSLPPLPNLGPGMEDIYNQFLMKLGQGNAASTPKNISEWLKNPNQLAASLLSLGTQQLPLPPFNQMSSPSLASSPSPSKHQQMDFKTPNEVSGSSHSKRLRQSSGSSSSQDRSQPSSHDRRSSSGQDKRSPSSQERSKSSTSNASNQDRFERQDRSHERRSSSNTAFSSGSMHERDSSSSRRSSTSLLAQQQTQNLPSPQQLQQQVASNAASSGLAAASLNLANQFPGLNMNSLLANPNVMTKVFMEQMAAMAGLPMLQPPVPSNVTGGSSSGSSDKGNKSRSSSQNPNSSSLAPPPAFPNPLLPPSSGSAANNPYLNLNPNPFLFGLGNFGMGLPNHMNLFHGLNLPGLGPMPGLDQQQVPSAQHQQQHQQQQQQSQQQSNSSSSSKSRDRQDGSSRSSGSSGRSSRR